MKLKRSDSTPGTKYRHEIFQEQVASGYFSPSKESVDKLVLIPHFDPPNLELFLEKTTQYLVRPKKKNVLKKADMVLSTDELQICKDKARKEALLLQSNTIDRKIEIISSKSFGKLPFPDEKLENDEDTLSVLRKGYRELLSDVERLEKQNQTLKAHLQLLERAKQSLLVTEQCAIQGIDWQLQQIQNHYQKISGEN